MYATKIIWQIMLMVNGARYGHVRVQNTWLETFYLHLPNSPFTYGVPYFELMVVLVEACNKQTNTQKISCAKPSSCAKLLIALPRSHVTV